MGALAVFGIENDGLNLAVNLLLLFLVVIWLALIYWTCADARRRIDDPMLVGCATAASLFPFVGTIVYLIVRPPEYLEDVRERELEIAAAEARLATLEQHALPVLRLRGREGLPALPELPAAPARSRARVCGKPLDPRWKICPYCEAEVGQAPRRGAARAASRAAAAAGQRPPRAARRQSRRRAPARHASETVRERNDEPPPSAPPARRASARSEPLRQPEGAAWTGP